MIEQKQFVVVIPPDFMFRSKKSPDIMDKFPVGHLQGNVAEKIVIDETGVHQEVKGTAVRAKGFPYPFAIDAVNTIKKATLILLFTFSIFPPLLLIFLSKRIRTRFLSYYAEFTHWVLCIYYLDPVYYKPIARHIWEVGMKIEHQAVSNGKIPCEKTCGVLAHSSEGFHKCGKTDVIIRLTELLAFFFEYETAYALRMQDFFTELNEKRFIIKPIREFYRVMRACRKRENRALQNKWSMLILVGLFILIFFKKKVVEIAKQLQWDKLKFDKDDLFWISDHRGDYQFLGKTQEERKQMLGNFEESEMFQVIK